MASPTKRCYFLELPLEVRVIIYQLSFNNHSKLSMPSRNNTAEVAAQHLKKDCARLLKQSAILHTNRNIMREALPMYQKALQIKIHFLKASVNGFEEMKKELSPMQLLMMELLSNDALKIATGLRNTKTLMERQLAG